MNLIARVEFELTPYDDEVQHVNHYLPSTVANFCVFLKSLVVQFLVSAWSLDMAEHVYHYRLMMCNDLEMIPMSSEEEQKPCAG